MLNNKLKERVCNHWNNNPMDYDQVNVKIGSKEYYKQINNQFYDTCYFGQTKGEPLFSRLIDYKKLKGKKVLEVGCGAGTIAVEFAKAYTKKQTKKMFLKFKKIKFETFGVKNEVFIIPFLRKLLCKLPNFIPNFFLEKLSLGWYLFIKVRK